MLKASGSTGIAVKAGRQTQLQLDDSRALPGPRRQLPSNPLDETVCSRPGHVAVHDHVPAGIIPGVGNLRLVYGHPEVAPSLHLGADPTGRTQHACKIVDVDSEAATWLIRACDEVLRHHWVEISACSYRNEQPLGGKNADTDTRTVDQHSQCSVRVAAFQLDLGTGPESRLVEKAHHLGIELQLF